MDIDRIRALVQLMVDNELTEVDIRSGEEQVSLKRGSSPSGPVVVAAPPASAQAVQAQAGPVAPAPPAAPAEDLVPIPSPMVGTFYAAPSPESPAYVTIGSEVAEDTVICIIEAMKVMNEIKAELRGTIVKVCARNGEAVEYGQPLFMVKKG